MPATFFERYQAGDHITVWNDLMSLGEAVRHEFYANDAIAVAHETMRRARHNIETLIQRLDAMGYRFNDHAASAEDELSRLDAMNQISASIDARFGSGKGDGNLHVQQLLDAKQAMMAKMGPVLKKAAERAAKQAAAPRKRPLQDPNVFRPPAKNTPKLVSKIEKKAGGPLPLSLSAWYEQVGHVSLMGSHPI
jgi:hypothetical protein